MCSNRILSSLVHPGFVLSHKSLTISLEGWKLLENGRKFSLSEAVWIGHVVGVDTSNTEVSAGELFSDKPLSFGADGLNNFEEVWHEGGEDLIHKFLLLLFVGSELWLVDLATDISVGVTEHIALICLHWILWVISKFHAKISQD